MASQLYGPAAKTGLNISGYVTEMIVFALETHHQYLFQTKKQKTNLQLYSSNSRMVAAEVSTQTHWTSDLRPQKAEQSQAVRQPDSLQKRAETRFCVRRRSGLHVVDWAANSGGSHKIKYHLHHQKHDCHFRPIDPLAAFWAPEERN